MSGPVYCGLHGYMGFDPCPNCSTQPHDPAVDPPRKPPVILNGERVSFEIRSHTKPKWIPLFIWNRLCKLVVRNVQITAKTEARQP